MANNRMWIRHKITGKMFPLARNGGIWSVGMSLGENGDILNKLDAFFQDHVSEDQLHNGDNYEIVTEHTGLQNFLLHRKY